LCCSCPVLLWRLLRPLNIFVIDDRFAMPMQVETPRGIASLSAKDCGRCIVRSTANGRAACTDRHGPTPIFKWIRIRRVSADLPELPHTAGESAAGSRPGFPGREKFDPILAPNPDYDAALRDEGVTCAVCHVRNGRIVGPFPTDSAPIRGIRSWYVPGHTTLPAVPCSIREAMGRILLHSAVRHGGGDRTGGPAVDCVGCHMPPVKRPAAEGMKVRKGRSHQFQGGHEPKRVKDALNVDYRLKEMGWSSCLRTQAPPTICRPHAGSALTLEVKLLGPRGRS